MPEANVLSPVAQMGSRFGYLERAPTPTTDMARGDDRAAITRRNVEDLPLGLALDLFRRRPPISALPVGLQRDIRAFFGSNSKA